MGLDRREAIRLLGGAAIAVPAALAQFIHPQSPPPRAENLTAEAKHLRNSRWTPGHAYQYMRRFGVLKGCNYVPADASSVWDDPDEYYIDRELGWAHKIGLNSIRVFVPGGVFQSNRENFFKRFDWLLETAAKHKLSFMPTLSVGGIRAPGEPAPPREAGRGFQPGVHGTPRRARRLPPPYRANWPVLKPLVKDFVETNVQRYGKDDRIIAWDLWNEPAVEDRPMVEDVFGWARNAGSRQPITAVWQGEDLSDIYSFHTYAKPGDPNGPEPGLPPFAEEMKHAVDSGRPLVCTECLARTFGNTFESFLPEFAVNRVGFYIWGLCAGTAQYQYPWRWPVGSPEPKSWFHCVLYPDGTPYRDEEVALIKSFGFTNW